MLLGARDAVFIGLDLAWSPNNPSGVAAIGRDGALVSPPRADLRDDAEILAWIRSHAAPTMTIAIDMPTIVPNLTGRRPCEALLAAEFRAAHAGPHPANRANRWFADGGRAAALVRALGDDGFRERLDTKANEPGRTVFECFPHPSLVRLFSLPRIFKYKKKQGRSWDSVLSEWARYRSALEALRGAHPPLVLDPAVVPFAVDKRGYKRWDDTLDAITCAYVASYAWIWGIDSPDMRVYGDLTSGYVVIPDRPFVAQKLESGGIPMAAKTEDKASNGAKQPFLSDITELRRRAKADIEKGAITPSYGGDVQQAIDILQSVLATEIVCVLRYTAHSIAAQGIDSEAVAAEFAQHAKEEREHMEMVAERIDQLGGVPNFNPVGLETRSASEYGTAETLIDMIKENLIAERIAVEHYRELIRYFADKDPTTRVMLEGITVTEEEHATDMHDLLVAHQGRPFIEK
jgi:bacterioferritin